ncbi:PREDICTED: uncharacterized protein C8orf86 homolog [Myotis brandtii]|uniref:uncharacterized protein C8orf86 homolog n=1 Tax=Myotis brandtii TaxID=109478 RepID=UPI0007043D1A|nr:PREDICTED: uncharacterized protein C8orf86 homolog [Myotis brandtii]
MRPHGERTPHCYLLLKTKSLGPGKGLGDCGGPSRKLAEEHWSKRPKPAKSGTEGKERVEQCTERQRTGSSKEPRTQIICRRQCEPQPPRLLWECLSLWA